MRRRAPITYTDKSFCFTGKRAELLRKDAEREVRARGGLSQSGVNATLDYLVVGDIPSPGWSFGDYGSKIDKAMQYRAAGARKPKIVSESDFLEDLATTAPTNSGAIDTKVIVCSYYLSVDDSVSPGNLGLNELADELSSIEGCNVKVKVYPSASVAILFSEEGVSERPDGWDIRVRVIKVAGLEYLTPPFVDAVAHVLGQRFGDAGSLTYTEKPEGSASFVKYLRELPKAQRVQVLSPE